MRLCFDDKEFDAQAQRTAAKAAYGSADLGQVFAIAARIVPGDYDSWYREWYAGGMANQAFAESSAAAGHGYSAGQAYLRASECYRSAYFFCRRDIAAEPLHAAWSASREMFWMALGSLPYPVERIHIPYGAGVLEGYIQRPPAGPMGPTLLMPCGYDSPVEEFYSAGGCEAAARGFTVVTFSGPGQAEMLYERQIPFRPDFEAVVGPVIDHLESRADIDSERIGILGRSFGGYLAPRAATKERRIKAVAADPAQLDVGRAIAGKMTGPMMELLENNDPAFNDAIWQLYPGVHGQEYWLSRASAHGVSTPLQYARALREYVVDVEAINCPTFVSYGEGDPTQSSAREFYDRLTVSAKKFTIYREEDGGGGHCEGMGPARYFADVLGWFGETLAV